MNAQSIREKEEKSKELERPTNSNSNHVIESKLQDDIAPLKSDAAGSHVSASFQQSYANFQSNYRQSTTMSHRKSPTTQQIKEMEEHLIFLKSMNPDSYEYNLGFYQAGRHDVSRGVFLKTAEAAKKGSKELSIQLVAYHTIQSDLDSRKKQLESMYTAGYFSSDLLGYAFDVLHTLPQNAVLLTHGVDDTFPLLIQQAVKGVRTDVLVLNLDWMQSADYRKTWAEKGYKLPTSSIIDAAYFGELCQLNPSKPLYHGLTIPSVYLSRVPATYAVHGLVMTSGASDASNYKLYMSNFQSKSFDKATSSQGKSLMMNFVPMLLSARNHALFKGEEKLAWEITEKVLRIAKAAGREEKVKPLLGM